MKHVFLAILIASILPACGWHLRGANSAVGQLTQINLLANDPYTALYRDFKIILDQRNISLSGSNDTPTVKLLDEQFDNRIVSLNTELDPAEVELMLSIRYQLNNDVREVSTQQTVRRDKNRAAARDNEIALRKKQMRTELIERILQQASLAANSSENISR